MKYFEHVQMKPTLQVIIFLYIPLFVTLLIYWPGLTGPFMFDDTENLKLLMKERHSDTFERLYYFIMSGDAGPLGRPISLLSFLLNDNAWPSSPWSFKYTNLLIHLLNGCLVFILTLQLSKFTTIDKNYRYFFAGLVMTIWLLHPIQTSTVLYVIQRMTQLSTLFMLLAIVTFLYGRNLLINTPSRTKAYLAMSFGIISFGLLSAFSKENGVLIFLYIATIEYILCRNIKMPKHYRYWKHLFISLPVLMLFIIFIVKFQSFQNGYAIRDFTMYERILTETRILCDYLLQFIFPRSGGTGVFHDDYIKSSSILAPPQTLISMITIATLLVAGFAFRRKYMLFSFSIFWFFSGHVLESTIVPLELYFEHRNYLSIFGPIFLLCALSLKVGKHLIKSNLLLLIYISLIILITYYNNTIWGDRVLASNVWASEKPFSIRAQQAASNIAIGEGNYRKARAYIANVHKKYPNHSALIVQLLLLDCNSKQLTNKQLSSSINTLTYATYSHATIPTVIELYGLMKNRYCEALTIDKMLDIVRSLIKNKNYNSASNLHALHYWEGLLYADKHQLNEAMHALDLAGKYISVVDIPLQQSAWLLSAGLYEEALKYVNKAELSDKNRQNLLFRGRRSKDIENMRSIIIKRKHEDHSQK